MAVRTFDPNEVALIFGGVPLSGYPDGTFVSVERNEDSFSSISGADGVVSRSKSNNKTGKITFTLQATSPSNDVLSGFLATDELTNAGILPVLVKDNSGRTLCSAANAWISKPSNVSFSKEIESREWIIECADLEMFVGGNAEFEAS